jgi:hypothetical protein
MKKWYLSKTLWINALGILAAVAPSTGEFIQANFAVAAPVWGVINMILRAVTKEGIQIA